MQNRERLRSFVDPIAHTLTGASLSAAGLRRATPLATGTLLVAANAPDIDVLAQLFGPYTALAFRRGITHGLPALVVLPFLIAGAILLWDRHVRLRRDPESQPASPLKILGLAALGVATHPSLDWLNTYGMRWLLPFDGRWSYGDALFIIDPWLWLLVGGAAFLGFSRSRRAQIAWGVLATALTSIVLLADIPAGAKVAWVAGVSGLALARVRAHPPLPGRGPSVAGVRFLVGGAVLYIVLMVTQARMSEAVVRSHLAQYGITDIRSLMVAPAPANPFAGTVVVELSDLYLRGSFRWLREPRFVGDLPPLDRGEELPEAAAARTSEDVRRYLVWSRFPFYQVELLRHGYRVRVGDARFPEGAGGGGIRGPTILLDPQLDPRSPGWGGPSGSR